MPPRPFVLPAPHDRPRPCPHRTAPREVGARALILALVMLAFAPRPARADGALNGLAEALTLMALGVLGEVAMPDLRWEWGADGFTEGGLVPTWPVPLSLVSTSIGDGLGLGVEARGEVQYRPDHGARGLGAARVGLYRSRKDQIGRYGIEPFHPHLGLYAEGGWAGGADGSGPVAGGGLIVGSTVVAGIAGYRIQGLGDGEWRHSIGLDLHLALPVYEWF